MTLPCRNANRPHGCRYALGGVRQENPYTAQEYARAIALILLELALAATTDGAEIGTVECCNRLGRAACSMDAAAVYAPKALS
jgi:hypothetical protein